MAIARLTHLRLSIPLSGAPPGKVPESCFPDAETAVTQPLPRRVSFAEDVDTLNTEDDLPVLSQISPPLTQPVVEEMEEDTQTSEVDGLEISSPESERPSPPVFPPFVFREDDGGIDADEIGARFGGYATETCQQMDPGLPDIPEAPELVVPRPPSPNNISEVMPAVGYACVSLPSINNGVIPELVRMPAFPQTKGRAVDRGA